jgi:hypothetical protein
MTDNHRVTRSLPAFSSTRGLFVAPGGTRGGDA